MIQSLDRGIKILDLIAEKKLVGVIEIAALFKINKSSAFRLLDTLRANNLVEKDKITEKYRISANVLKYSRTFLRNSIVKTAHPYLAKLLAQINENVSLAAFSNEKIIIIDNCSNDSSVNLVLSYGSETNIYCSSLGKVICANLPDDVQNRIIASTEFFGRTDRTITSKTELMNHFKKIQNDGYAVDDEEYTDGVRSIAAPIRNNLGEVNYSLGISAPVTRLDPQMIPGYAKIIMDIASEISIQCGYKPNDLYCLI